MQGFEQVYELSVSVYTAIYIINFVNKNTQQDITFTLSIQKP